MPVPGASAPGDPILVDTERGRDRTIAHNALRQSPPDSDNRSALNDLRHTASLRAHTLSSMDSQPARAWRVHTYGPPLEALRLDAVEVSPPGPEQVQVSVQAVGLNHPDLLLCAGRYQERPSPPFSPGFEAAGVVMRTGRGSTHRAGEHVIVVPELPGGAMQQSLTVPDTQVYPVPSDVSPTVAAVLHIAYATAHAALHRRAAVEQGETVLVSGAAGGVGTAAVQLAHAAGARVIALATGASKSDACRASGADAVIDLAQTGDLTDRVRDVTDGRGAEVVIDVVGGSLFHELRRVVAFEGRLVTVGFTSGDVPSEPVNHALLRNYSLVGLHLARYRLAAPAVLRDIHDTVIDLHRAGHIRPVVHRVLPFGDAPAALDLLARREVVGRVVLSL